MDCEGLGWKQDTFLDVYVVVCFLSMSKSGFMGAMISNLAFVFRNIFSKKGMKGKSVSGMNYYACLSILSLVLLTPFAIAVEGPQMWAAGFQQALSEIGPQIVWYSPFCPLFILCYLAPIVSWIFHMISRW